MVTSLLPSSERAHRIAISLGTMVRLVLVVATCWLIVRLLPVVLVLIASLMLAGLLNPVVERLEARGVRRLVGIGMVFSVLVAMGLLVAIFAIPQVLAQGGRLIEQEPLLREQLALWLAKYQVTASIATSLREVDYTALFGSSTQLALASSVRAFQFVAYGVGAVFLALYMMIDRDRLRGALFAVVPRPHHIRLSRIMANLERIVGGYIRGQAITCGLMGVFLYAVLTIVGAEGALALAFIGALADVLPYIGIFFVIIPAVLATLPMGPLVAGGVALALFVYQEIESRFLMPVVYGRALRLPSSVVLIALLAGGTLMGIVGALLALPVAAAALMLVDELRVELPGSGETAAHEQQRERDEVTIKEYALRTEGLPAHEAAAIAVEITIEQSRSDETVKIAIGPPNATAADDAMSSVDARP